MTVHARAPLRLSLAGGGTDVPPYPERYGGAVLSCTIDQYAYASVRKSSGAGAVDSPDLETAAALSGRVALARSVIDAFDQAMDVVLGCDAPPGSGLGASSSLIVALCAASAALTNALMTPYELAERALRIERDVLEIPGGMQDQFAAAFGGFNFIEFGVDGVLVNPLRPRSEVVAELQASLLLLPTPVVSRRSSGILRRQIDAYEREDPAVLEALSDMRDQAVRMKAALLRGEIDALADLLDQGWRSKRALADGIATEEIDELYDETRRLGVLGGKLLGAGGGGYLLLLVPFEERWRVVRDLRGRRLQPMNVSFCDQGVHVWHRPG